MGMAREILLDPLTLLLNMTKNKPEYEVENVSFDKAVAAATKKSAGKGQISEDVARELEQTRFSCDEKMEQNQKATSKNFVKVFLSDRVIRVPNIPVIGDILFKIKSRKSNNQIEEVKEILEREQKITDSTVKAAVATNQFTNHGGKGVVKTTAAVKGDTSNQREPGGEVRTRKGR